MRILNFLLKRAIGKRTEPTAISAFFAAVIAVLADRFGWSLDPELLNSIALALAALAVAFLGDRLNRSRG